MKVSKLQIRWQRQYLKQHIICLQWHTRSQVDMKVDTIQEYLRMHLLYLHFEKLEVRWHVKCMSRKRQPSHPPAQLVCVWAVKFWSSEQVHGELSLHWLFSILTGLYMWITSVQKAGKVTGMPYRKFNCANTNTVLILTSAMTSQCH